MGKHIGHFLDLIGKTKLQYGKALEQICDRWKLSRNEMDVLLFLYNNPQLNRATDIVTRRGISKAYVSLAVAKLERQGLLLREYVPNDRRSVCLLLTEAGSAIGHEGRVTQEQYVAQLCAGITPEELEEFDRITGQIYENICSLEEQGR